MEPGYGVLLKHFFGEKFATEKQLPLLTTTEVFKKRLVIFIKF